MLSALLSCSADQPRPALAPIPSPSSSEVAKGAPSATALPVTAWSGGKASDCAGIFIAPRRHCFKGEVPPAPTLSSASNNPHILILTKYPDTNLPWRITKRCIFSEEQTVLPVEGLELEVRLVPTLEPEVVRADERLGLELIACTARVVSEEYVRENVTVVFFPGDIENKELRTQLDAVKTPEIFVEFQHVGTPLTKASALRLLRVNAEELRACVRTHFKHVPNPAAGVLGRRRVALEFEMSFGQDGRAAHVKVSGEPKYPELGKCVETVHRRLTSTIYSEDGTTTLKLQYWLLGSPRSL